MLKFGFSGSDGRIKFIKKDNLNLIGTLNKFRTEMIFNNWMSLEEKPNDMLRVLMDMSQYSLHQRFCKPSYLVI